MYVPSKFQTLLRLQQESILTNTWESYIAVKERKIRSAMVYVDANLVLLPLSPQEHQQVLLNLIKFSKGNFNEIQQLLLKKKKNIRTLLFKTNKFLVESP